MIFRAGDVIQKGSDSSVQWVVKALVRGTYHVEVVRCDADESKLGARYVSDLLNFQFFLVPDGLDRILEKL